MRSPVIQAWFRFYAGLNDLLPPSLRNREFPQQLTLSDSVKHVIESLGVPHTEVDLIVVNGEPAGWERHLCDGDRISVYPLFAALDPGEFRLQPPPLSLPAFVADGHLGRLAAYLRMLGLDTAYDRDAGDEALAMVSAAEDRILLTRDVGLLKRRNVIRGYLVRSHHPMQQLAEVTLRYGLLRHEAPFSRCMECNGRLQAAERSEVEDLLPPHTRATKDVFSRCERCQKVFWRGSHHSRMSEWIEQLRLTAGDTE